MLSQLFISDFRETQINKVTILLEELKIPNPHPDLLWIESVEEKSLGVKDTKEIREFLSFKPHSARGKVVVVLGADTFSLDAQNALLKTLEEPPASASIILTATSEQRILPTIISRCKVEILIHEHQTQSSDEVQKTIKKLFSSSVEKRFQIIEKTEDREELFKALVEYATFELPKNLKLLEFAKKINEAEKFYKHQGNIRTILEYLMLSW